MVMVMAGDDLTVKVCYWVLVGLLGDGLLLGAIAYW